MGIIQDSLAHQSAALESNAENDAEVCGSVDFARLTARELSNPSAERSENFQIVIRQSALNGIHAHGDATPRVEICGVLVGDVYQDHAGAYLLVEEIIEGQSAPGGAGQVTFTADTWQHIQTTMESRYPLLRIVGWYHTHPGHGIFLSEMDVFLHESFFGLPWQAALVYDPQSGEEGVFSGNSGAVSPRNYLIERDEAAKALGSEGYRTAGKISSPSPKAAPGAGWRILGHIRRGFLGIIGLALFAATGFLAGYLIKAMHLQIPLWLQQMARDFLRYWKL